MKKTTHYTLLYLVLWLFSFGSKGQSCIQANFDYFPTNPPVFIFKDTSTIAAGYTNASYTWSFGDGTIGSGRFVSHSFQPGSTYNVCLKVEAYNPQTQSFCQDSICKVVSIAGCNLQTAFTYTVNPNGVAILNATQTGGTSPYNYYWYVNGTPTNTSQPTYTVVLPNGVNQVCLYTYDANQCFDSTCQFITVQNNCANFNFTISKLLDTANQKFSAYANPTGGQSPYTYSWSNGATTQVIQNVNPGIYCVTVSDANGCVKSKCDTFKLPNTNCANFNFTISKLLDTATQTYSAYANPTGGQQPYTYQWSNGATTQVIQNANSGVYCVTVTDALGCTNSKCDTFGSNTTNNCPTLMGQVSCGNLTTFSFGTGNGIWNFVNSGGAVNGCGYATPGEERLYRFYATQSGMYTIKFTGSTNSDYIDWLWKNTSSGCNQNGWTCIKDIFDTATYQIGPLVAGQSYYLVGDREFFQSTTTSKTGTFIIECPKLCTANFQVTSTCDSIFISNTSTIGTGTYNSGTWKVGTNTYPLTSNLNGLKLPRSIIGGGVSVNIILEYSLNNGCTDTMRKTITLAPCYSDTVCGVAFIDLNGNGVFDNTDSVLKFQTVCLYGSGIQQCAQTNANGQYYIAVPAGFYTVYTYVSNGLSPTIPISSGNPNTLRGYDSVVISGGGRHCGYDFGFQDLRVTISGTVYFDLNNNGVQDAGENGVPNVLVKIGGFSVYTNSMGFYTRQVPAASYLVTYTASGSYVGYTVNPVSRTVAATTVGNSYGGNDFGLYIVPGTCNAKVNLIAYSNVTAGFPAMYKVYVYNIGSSVITGTLDFFHDPLLVFNYTSPAQTSYTANSISWNVGAIAPGSYKYFYINLSAPTTVQIGQPFFALADFNPNCTDVDLSNNVDTTHQLATASWDPNNKLVSPTGVGEMGKLKSSQKLTYIINFQNTGTAPAVNVVLIDTLSTHLDWNSVEVKESSHSSNVTIENGILNAKYSQIMLPDSNTNEPESHGFLSYTVNMKPNLPQGTVVNNTGHIYFDYNEAVITNTTVNTIDYALSIADPTKENLTVTLYPNPFKSHTTIQIEKADGRVFDLQILDMTGRIIYSQKANSEGVFNIDRNSIASGIYNYVVFENGAKRTAGKLIAE